MLLCMYVFIEYVISSASVLLHEEFDLKLNTDEKSNPGCVLIVISAS